MSEWDKVPSDIGTRCPFCEGAGCPRCAYRGGWCYWNEPGKQERLARQSVKLDVTDEELEEHFSEEAVAAHRLSTEPPQGRIS